MRTLRALLPFTRGRRVAIATGFGGTLLVTAAELARPFPLKIVLDRLLAGPSPVVDGGLLAAVAVLVVGIAVVGAAGSYLSEAWMRRVGEHVVHDLRVAVYAQLHRLSLRYHHGKQPGDLVTRLTGDVNAVGELTSESLVKVAGAVFLLVGMLAVSLALDPVLTLAAAAVTPVLAVATVRARRAVKGAARRQRAAEGAIAALSTESLVAVETVKALGTEAAEEERLRRRSEERREAGVTGAATEGRFGGVVDVLEAVGTAIVLVLGAFRVAAGALSPGDLVVMHSYVRRLYRPLRELARQSGRVARGMARAERVVEVLIADDALPERPGAYRGGPAEGALAMRDVHFSYGDRPALRGLSLDVAAGQTVAVVGSSGAGKSTLAALLARFHDPDAGAVLLDGRDLRDCSLGWLRDQIGVVLQDTALFSGTVADNIAYCTEASGEEIEAAARAVDAHEFIAALPRGYDTELGPGGHGLSGGQRQRLAIARALLRNPAVVVLDEPTSGLDADSESAVVASVERLLAGRTTVVITHSLRLAQRADKVVVLDRGEVVEEGPPQVLLGGSGRFHRLASKQGLVGAARVPAPVDAALPALASLLDPDGMAEVIGERIRERERLTGIAIRYIRYKPATNVVVDYDVTTTSGAHRAVVMLNSDGSLARRAVRPAAGLLAAKVEDRVPAPEALTYLPDLDALLQWLPLDVWIPALAEHAEDLASRAGVSLDHPAEPRLLAYKPRRRAVLGLDGHVLKLYADEPAFRVAATALLAGPSLPVDTAVPVGCDDALRVTAQEMIAGRPVDDPVASAAEAGELLARFHAARRPKGTPRLDPVVMAAASAGTVAALVPGLHNQLDRLCARLETTAAGRRAVLSHGDFHAGQLLHTGAGMAVLDLDEMGVGAPAMDLATYAAHLLDGTPVAYSKAQDALAALVDGYRRRPPGLDWHLSVAILRRAVFPFRTFPQPDWPDRVAAMVASAEAALDA